MRGLLLLALALAQSPAAFGDDDADIIAELAQATLPDPPMEAPPGEPIATERTERLQKALRCPVCQGLSVSDSPADAARAMGDRIEELVRQGYTEAQITEYFVDRYGAWVELEPPSDEHKALFYAPLIAIAVGLTVLFVLGGRRKQVTAPPSIIKLDPALAPWRARILAELGETEE